MDLRGGPGGAAPEWPPKGARGGGADGRGAPRRRLSSRPRSEGGGQARQAGRADAECGRTRPLPRPLGGRGSEPGFGPPPPCRTRTRGRGACPAPARRAVVAAARNVASAERGRTAPSADRPSFRAKPASTPPGRRPVNVCDAASGAEDGGQPHPATGPDQRLTLAKVPLSLHTIPGQPWPSRAQVIRSSLPGVRAKAESSNQARVLQRRQLQPVAGRLVPTPRP